MCKICGVTLSNYKNRIDYGPDGSSLFCDKCFERQRYYNLGFDLALFVMVTGLLYLVLRMFK